MPIFNFYALENKASEERKDLFNQTSVAVRTDTKKSDAVNTDQKPVCTTPEECLGSFFETGHSLELPILKTSGRGDEKTTYWDKHKCDVMRHEGGIILMTVEANKSKHTTIDKKDVEHQHHPYSTVIIDNRPGHQMVGIERNSAFDSNPDKLALILQQGISRLLMPYGRKVELRSLRKKSTEFWPVIDRLRTHYGDEVKQIRLDLSRTDEEAPTSAHGDLPHGGSKQRPGGSDLISIMSHLAKKTESAASFTLMADDEGEVKLQQVSDDVTHIAALCLEHPEYDLKVKFKQFGVYRYGADLMAQFGADDVVLDGFENGHMEFDLMTGASTYGLVAWLDKLDTLLNDYEKYAISTRRKTPRRRKVS